MFYIKRISNGQWCAGEWSRKNNVGFLTRYGAAIGADPLDLEYVEAESDPRTGELLIETPEPIVLTADEQAEADFDTAIASATSFVDLKAALIDLRPRGRGR